MLHLPFPVFSSGQAGECERQEFNLFKYNLSNLSITRDNPVFPSLPHPYHPPLALSRHFPPNTTLSLPRTRDFHVYAPSRPGSDAKIFAEETGTFRAP